MHISVMSQYDILPLNNIQEMEWVQYKYTQVRVRVLWTWMSTSTQQTNVYEYDYFTIYSSTITLQCSHDYNVIMITFLT